MGTSAASAAERASARASCMNWVSVSMFGERITCGSKRNGINTKNKESTKTAENMERKKRSLLDNWGGEKQTRRMRELLERLFQVDFLKGLAVTFRAQHPKNIVTEQYPLERPMVAERNRGAPRLNNNPETGETLCIGCNLCALSCPDELFVVGCPLDHATLLIRLERDP